ncbi:MAG: restriction endonuclease, partial [bacterium]|nr:restriction endonuclease [bacterium]
LAGDRIRLKPDISWWEGSRCVFVGDIKYKKTDYGIPNADLYQLLAYTIAADLPSGLLIYAQGEENPISHTIKHVGKRLEVVAVELSGPPDEILAEVSKVADTVRSMRLRASRHHAA